MEYRASDPNQSPRARLGYSVEPRRRNSVSIASECDESAKARVCSIPPENRLYSLRHRKHDARIADMRGNGKESRGKL